jgi:Family of unknown function (DUF5683)
MARKFTFLLMSWLLCTHFTIALAVTPRQERAHSHTPAQSGKKAIPFPREALWATFNATSKVAAQENIVKKHRYVAEEMVMQRAWIYSAILPGWGQVCNAHYWKVPVIYAGFAGFLGGAIYYHREYFQAKRELIQEKRTSRGSLENYVNDCRADRDLCFILTTLWYVINVFDAYVGASLKTFTLSDDISARIEPTTLLTPCNLPTVGLSLTLSFQNENTPDRLRKDGAGY